MKYLPEKFTEEDYKDFLYGKITSIADELGEYDYFYNKANHCCTVEAFEKLYEEVKNAEDKSNSR